MSGYAAASPRINGNTSRSSTFTNWRTNCASRNYGASAAPTGLKKRGGNSTAAITKNMETTMLQSETTADLSAALVKAQAAMKSAAFNKVNPHFKNRYADLAAIIDAVRKPLTDNGLSFTQTTEVHVGDCFLLVTTLRHVSGQWIAGTYPLPMNAKPQELGSALTYAKRYSLSSITGIAADEDDDAEVTRKNGNGADMIGGKITTAQVDELYDLAAEVGADVDKFCAYMKVAAVGDLPLSKLAEAKAALEGKRKK